MDTIMATTTADLAQVTSTGTSATTDTSHGSNNNNNNRFSSSSSRSICRCSIVSPGGLYNVRALCDHDPEQQQQMLQQYHDTVYYDPYTALPEGYVLQSPSHWRRMLSKMRLQRRTSSSSAGSSSTLGSSGTAAASSLTLVAKYAGRSSNPAKLTVRNLQEFFDPASYDDELDVFKDPRTRENPYANHRRRERVDKWIDNLP